MTIKLQNYSVIYTIWISYNWFFLTIILKTSIERPQRRQLATQQHIVSKRSNIGKNRILQNRCVLSTTTGIIKLNQHFVKKRHTLTHVFIAVNVRKLIFFVPCAWLFDDEMNFDDTELKDETKRHIIWYNIKLQYMLESTSNTKQTTNEWHQESNLHNKKNLARTHEESTKKNTAMTHTSKFETINKYHFEKKKLQTIPTPSK